jgi:hypothetical protein
MARLDRAIQEKARHFKDSLDGRVKPGHDSGDPNRFLHTLEGGNPVISTATISEINAIAQRLLCPRLRGTGAAAVFTRSAANAAKTKKGCLNQAAPHSGMSNLVSSKPAGLDAPGGQEPTPAKLAKA